MTAAGTGQAQDRDTVPGLPADLTKVRHLARHQVMGLTGTFLLGMAVNLIGLPSEASGGAHIASLAFLAGHVLIALGLVVGAGMLLRAIPDSTRTLRKQAILGAAAISTTTAAGVLTLLTKATGGHTLWQPASSPRSSPTAASWPSLTPRATDQAISPVPPPSLRREAGSS